MYNWASKATAQTTDGFQPRDHRVSRDGIGFAAGLTDEQIQRAAPAIFAESAHESRSDRYGYVSTKQLLDAMRGEGFMPVFVGQAKSRTEDKRGHAKHIIRFRRADELHAALAREIATVNSHDGSSAYSLYEGLYRQLCSNGLIVGSAQSEVKIRHGKNALHDVIEASYRMVNDFQAANDAIERMKTKLLTGPQQTQFAKGALMLRYPDADQDNLPVQPERLLRIRRAGDEGSDVFTVFNRLQESLIRGGVRGWNRDANGRIRNNTVRPINGIDQSVSLNRQLWQLADMVAKAV